MKNLLLTGSIALIFGFIFGYFIKYCPKCEECIEYHKINDKEAGKIEKLLDIKREEIKKETNEKLIFTDTTTINKLDSIWAEFEKRYGFN